eukprot:1992904-Amphidinium_carterae.1
MSSTRTTVSPLALTGDSNPSDRRSANELSLQSRLECDERFPRSLPQAGSRLYNCRSGCHSVKTD